QFLQHYSSLRGRGLGCRETQLRAALHDSLVKQTLRGPPHHQRADLGAAARLAEHGNVRRIAAEATDVVAYPLQRGDDDEHADVDGAGELLAPDPPPLHP